MIQDALRVCVVELAGHSFGLRLESIREIVPMAALSRPPSIPSVLEGFLNRQGTAVPVMKIAGLLGLPPVSLDLYTPLVILRGGALPLALLVNRVTGIVAFPPGSLVPIAEADSFNGCVEGQLTSAAGAVHLLSLDRLLTAKERQILTEFQATENGRLVQLGQQTS